MRHAIAMALLVLTAAAAPATAGEVVSRQQGGVTVLGELALAPGKALKDGVVLMLHGSLQHRDQELLAALEERLTERGFNTLSVTLSLGVDKREGPFDCAQPHRHRHQDAVAELAGWVDHLKGQGAGPITLLGHSRGGNQVARYLAAGGDPAVAKAVLVAPATGLDPAQSAELLKLADGKGDDTLVDVPRFLTCPAGKATAASIRSYHADDGGFSTPALLPKVKPPVLVLAASDDTVVPDLPKLMAGVNQPNVTFRTIDQSDHFFRDFAADDTADAIAEFLEAP